jgi:nucleotide-binding universal stress UspA family protein
MLEHIMVALDGSRLAEQTLPFASALARAFDSEIILLRVVETPPGGTGGALDSFDWRMERTEAIAYLRSVKQRLRDEGISVDLDVTAGRACEEILEMARARDIDLLLIGSHGVGGLTEFHMASTTHKVVFASETSVLVVPACESVAEGKPFASVLVPVDCTPHSDWAVALSARLARAEGVDLSILHVVRTPQLLDPAGTERERRLVDELVTLNRGAASRYLDDLKRRLEAPDMQIHTHIEVADEVASVVEAQASAEERPLLVLTTRGVSRFADQPFGSLVAVMLASTTHPALVLREANPKVRNNGRSRSGATMRPRRSAIATE